MEPVEYTSAFPAYHNPAYPVSRPSLIGLGGYAGAGKTFLADRLVADHNFIRFKFADTLKAMTRAFLFGIGMDAGDVEASIDGPLKEKALPGLPYITPRVLMQTLGTEWGRNSIHRDVWVRVVEQRVQVSRSQGFNIVLDDVRFANEADMIRRLGGIVVQVHGPDVCVGRHVSERQDYHADNHIANTARNPGYADIAASMLAQWGRERAGVN